VPRTTQRHFEEAKSLLLKTMPVAQRILGENNEITLKMRWIYGQALYKDPAATLDDLREAVTTLEDLARTARHVFGSAHPDVVEMENHLKVARAALGSREMTAAGRGTTRFGDVRSIREAVAAMASTKGSGDAQS